MPAAASRALALAFCLAQVAHGWAPSSSGLARRPRATAARAASSDGGGGEPVANERRFRATSADPATEWAEKSGLTALRDAPADLTLPKNREELIQRYMQFEGLTEDEATVEVDAFLADPERSADWLYKLEVQKMLPDEEGMSPARIAQFVLAFSAGGIIVAVKNFVADL